jgi:hypothetical protein
MVNIMTDIKKALLDPTAVFDDPMQVLHATDLTKEQKIEILQRWRYDVMLQETAQEENMAGNGQGELFEKVNQALHSLGNIPFSWPSIPLSGSANFDIALCKHFIPMR